jgi:hypothetical protein
MGMMQVVEGKWAVVAQTNRDSAGKKKKEDDQTIRLVYFFNTGEYSWKKARITSKNPKSVQWRKREGSGNTCSHI